MHPILLSRLLLLMYDRGVIYEQSHCHSCFCSVGSIGANLEWIFQEFITNNSQKSKHFQFLFNFVSIENFEAIGKFVLFFCKTQNWISILTATENGLHRHACTNSNFPTRGIAWRSIYNPSCWNEMFLNLSLYNAKI